MSASPATGETIFLMAAAARLMALSKASGPSSTAPVICPRSAILQSAAASSVPGIFGFTVSTAERMATFGARIAQRVQHVHRVLDDVRLGHQVRRDVDGGVGDEERLVVGRHVHGEDMADPARAAQAALARHDGRHQLVGVQAALHQRPGAALAAEPHGGGRGRVRRLRLDQLAAVERAPRRRPRPPRSSRAARPGWAAWRPGHAPAAARAGCRGRRARPPPRSAAAPRRCGAAAAPGAGGDAG